MQDLRRWAILGALFSVVFTTGFILGGRGGMQSAPSPHPENMPPEVDFTPVWKAWSILNEKFIPSSTTAQVSEQDRVWGIVSGLANSYDDPYTVFFPPEEAKNFQDEISGSFGGVGIEMGFRDGTLTVIAPLKGTPAERAGMRAGDLIVEVDGVSTQNMTMDDAIHVIRGDVGTPVTFTVARKGEGEFITIPVTRDTIDVPTMKYETVGDDVFVISLYNFGGTATREMQTALRAFITGSYDKLLIDMRGNPGGYLSASVDIASWFLPAGKVVVTEDYGDEREDLVHRSKGNDITDQDWRIAILVDGGSASASEILAGALREQGKAVLIGEQTFGKGSVQELIELTPETALKVTVARWLTPNGLSISQAGLTPDLVVPMTSEDIDAERDPQKDAAIRYLKTGMLETLLQVATTTSSTTPLEASGDLE